MDSMSSKAALAKEVPVHDAASSIGPSLCHQDDEDRDMAVPHHSRVPLQAHHTHTWSVDAPNACLTLARHLPDTYARCTTQLQGKRTHRRSLVLPDTCHHFTDAFCPTPEAGWT